MTDIKDMESSLQKLLSTLKINREKVPLETLKSVYRIPYEELKAQIKEQVQTFVLHIACHHLLINPKYPLDEQTAVVQSVVDQSCIPKEISHSLSKDYDVQKIYQLALRLRQEIENALWPYIDQETCLVTDLENPDQTPVIYNALMKQIYQDGHWLSVTLDLQGKLLIYPKQNQNENHYLLQKGKNT